MHAENSMDSAESAYSFASSAPSTSSKRDHVKQVFEDVAHYLSSRRVDIRFRKEVARAFAKAIEWRTALDIGCGDGSISLPLLRSGVQLTLLDLSTAMTVRAKANVPHVLAHAVTVRNDDFLSAEFKPEPFDLIIAVGVIAHVDSADLFLGRIRSLLRPGGSLILEFTDCEHFVGRLGRFWGGLKECLAPPKYQTNKVSFKALAPLFESHGFRLVSAFRYARIPLPTVDRLLSEQIHYRICKRVFGSSSHNTNAGLGNEYICLLTAA